MLVLRRREGQTIDLRHTSGDVVRITAIKIGHFVNGRPCVELVFDDAARNFEIYRAEIGRTGKEAG